MNREQAKQMFRDDKDSYGKPKAVMSKIDKIYDEFEKDILNFAEWMDIEAIRSDEHVWKYKGDNYEKKYSTQLLYEIWKTTK